MPRVHANGLSFHVNRFRTGPEGERPVVVLVHGLAVVDNASMSFMFGLHLATDADVISYDLRGHGRSDQPPTGYTVADHVADLIGLLDALEITRPIHLVCASFGGAIATVAAVRHPDRVASLSLLDGIVPTPGWEEALAGTVGNFNLFLDESMSDEEHIERIIKDYGVSRRRATNVSRRVRRVLENTTLRQDLLAERPLGDDELAGISCPVLGVYGDESEIFWLVDRLPGLIPSIDIHIIPNADHVSVFWWHTQELRVLVRRFIGLPTPDASPATSPAQGGDLVGNTTGDL